MGKLVIDGNKVYTIDEACMRRKKLTLEQVRAFESGKWGSHGQEESSNQNQRDGFLNSSKKKHSK